MTVRNEDQSETYGLATSAGDLAASYRAVRAETERRAAPLSPEDQCVQSMPDCSPAKWHRAHTSWFFETFLLTPHLDGYTPFDPSFTYLFNSYYEAVGPRHARPQRGMLTRPSADAIAAYRAHVDAAMATYLQTRLPPDQRALVELGLAHEQQHQELLLTDILHAFSINPTRPAYEVVAAPAPRDPPPLDWIQHAGGLYEIGYEGLGFAFDNETPRHTTYVRAFKLATRPTSVGEYLDFIEDGGYRDASLWHSEGWALVQQEQLEAPLHWVRDGDGWLRFGLHGLRPLDPGEPVAHLSWFEASAFAHWTGARLPTEAEWELGLVKLDLPEPGFAAHPRQMESTRAFGDVWEWTASAYAPYPGFSPEPGAVGEYNGKFMINQQVLRGRSCFTPAEHARLTYRNFFPPSARWQVSGFRLARDA
ncbi:ergothioneine biosynthesis protein EgtB [Roseiterribacter gracilis]|uniref:Ergothioneine biosynthesis protein EgtB n=1 Tax=Roseiterribacter gracilis TaxID=2812848 RepID=A0A8S8X613_9PROT|nr:ergothioneine biosynthesis protein EgtB [Rhodospirillales bacterium TMPK1]